MHRIDKLSFLLVITVIFGLTKKYKMLLYKLGIAPKIMKCKEKRDSYGLL